MLLNDSKLAELFSRKGRTYPADSVIFLEYESGHEMYIIVSGQVEITKTFKESEIFGGAQITIGEVSELMSTLCPGDFFGEMALWNDTLRMATATAKTQVEVIVLSKNELELMMMRSPALAMQMIKSICSRLRDVSSSPRIETIMPYLQEILHSRERRPIRPKDEVVKDVVIKEAEPAHDPIKVEEAQRTVDHAAQFIASSVKGRSCAVCGYQVQQDDRYCGLCGRPLKASS